MGSDKSDKNCSNIKKYHNYKSVLQYYTLNYIFGNIPIKTKIKRPSCPCLAL